MHAFPAGPPPQHFPFISSVVWVYGEWSKLDPLQLLRFRALSANAEDFWVTPSGGSSCSDVLAAAHPDTLFHACVCLQVKAEHVQENTWTILAHFLHLSSVQHMGSVSFSVFYSPQPMCPSRVTGMLLCYVLMCYPGEYQHLNDGIMTKGTEKGKNKEGTSKERCWVRFRNLHRQHKLFYFSWGQMLRPQDCW